MILDEMKSKCPHVAQVYHVTCDTLGSVATASPTGKCGEIETKTIVFFSPVVTWCILSF